MIPAAYAAGGAYYPQAYPGQQGFEQDNGQRYRLAYRKQANPYQPQVIQQYLVNPENLAERPGKYDYVIRVPMPENPMDKRPMFVPQQPPKRLPQPPQRYEVYNARDELSEPRPDYHGEVVNNRGPIGTEVLELEENIIIEEPRQKVTPPSKSDHFDRAHKIKQKARTGENPLQEFRVKREDMLREQLHDSINNREQQAIERIGERIANMLVLPKQERQPVTEIYQIPRHLITGEARKKPQFIAMQLMPDGSMAPLDAGIQVVDQHGHAIPTQQPTNLPPNIPQIIQPTQAQQIIRSGAALPLTQPSRPVTTHVNVTSQKAGLIQPEDTQIQIVSYGEPTVNMLGPAVRGQLVEGPVSRESSALGVPPSRVSGSRATLASGTHHSS